MNVGYVSYSFLDKIQDCHHRHSSGGTGTKESSSSSSSATSQSQSTKPPRTAYFLRLDAPSSSISSSEGGVVVIEDGETDKATSCRVPGVGMPIRLFPLADHQLRHETVVSDDADDDGVEKEEEAVASAIVYLHPIMLHVLATSSIMASESSSVSSSRRRWNHHSKQDENHPHSNIPVVLLPTIDNYYSTSSMANGMILAGTLEILDNKNANNSSDDEAGNDDTDNGETCHTAIHLEYMCSTTTKGRNLFHSTNANHNSRRNHVLLPRGGLEDQTIRNQLMGMTIVEGGIIGIDMDDDDVGVENVDCYNEDCGINQNVVFFMVNKIANTKGGENSSTADTTTIRARYLPISTCCSYDIMLDPPSLRQADGDNDEVDTVAETHNADSIGTKPRPPRRCDGSNMDLNHDSHDSIHFVCPGYESILNELISLARMMNNPDAYPSAVLLSGCSGVGKTRMVRSPPSVFHITRFQL